MGKFKRKNNYSNETIKEVKELLDAGILMIPGPDEFKGYEKGLVIISRLTDMEKLKLIVKSSLLIR